MEALLLSDSLSNSSGKVLRMAVKILAASCSWALLHCLCETVRVSLKPRMPLKLAGP